MSAPPSAPDEASAIRHRVIGTAGHIDHGKSALVMALTGVDPDRLGEEKRRGITIELGFAEATLAAGEVVSFVDVPGHERFVRHMVAGASGIEAVLLVVALDQGVQPQTREHLQICRLLGLRRGVVALTKSDLVDEELAEVAALEVAELLEGTFLEDAEMIPVSSKTGAGLDRLKQALVALGADAEERAAREGQLMRLPVDRSFVLKGFGTVVTGTLSSGLLEESAELEVLPGGGRARVRGIQMHGHAQPRALAGHRTAVNLQGVECAEVPRGSVLVPPGAIRPTTRFWARVTLLPDAPESLRRGGRVRLHHGTSDVAARLHVLNQDESEDGLLHAVLFASTALPLSVGDRFVLRRPAPVDTVGGGVVVDTDPPHPRRRTEHDFVSDAEEPSSYLWRRVARLGFAGETTAALAERSGLTREAVDAQLRAGERLLAVGNRWYERKLWEATSHSALETLKQFHIDQPLQTAIDREALRSRVAAEMPQEAWRQLLRELAEAKQIELNGDQLHVAGHRVELDPQRERRASEIAKQFETAGLTPPEAEDLLQSNSDRELLQLLIARGSLIRIHDGKIFHADALEALRKQLWTYAETHDDIDVSEFKDLAGLTRKHAIPLLEHFDAERTTRRVGNRRQILPPPG